MSVSGCLAQKVIDAGCHLLKNAHFSIKYCSAMEEIVNWERRTSIL